MILFYLIFLIVVILLSPLLISESRKLRYFLNWASLTLSTGFISIFCLLFLPFSSRIRCCSHIRRGSIGSKIALKLAGVEVEGKDVHKTDIQKRFIVLANHQSFLDIIGLVSVWDILGNCIPVAKKDLLYIWPFGLINWVVGTIFVDRDRNGSGYIQILEQAKKHFSKYEGKTSILIFPEGTRGNGEEFGKFKQGAFKLAIELKLPILPIVIARFDFIKYLEYFKKGKFVYRVLDPIPTTDYTLDDIDKLSDKTKNIMFKEYLLLNQDNKMY